MKTCPKMKTVVEQLAGKHGIDLSKSGAHFRINLPGFDRLCVENLGSQRISVAHYFEMNGDLVPEPDIVFFVDAQGKWIPIEITQSMTGQTEYAQLSQDKTRILLVLLVNEPGQHDLAEFAEQWAQNIEEQGWLERGVKHEYA